MPTVDALLKRNHDFAAERFEPLPAIPPSRTLIITCADVRVDPAHILGLELGEAGVVRNVGGRVTPHTIQMLGMLAAVAAAEGASGGWELVLLQHTDCGMTRLTGYPDMLSDYLGVSAQELPARFVTDPRQGVAADVDVLRGNPALPGSLVVSGLVYDVATGGVETVVPAAPLR
jgi:carbonic anhydrase